MNRMAIMNDTGRSPMIEVPKISAERMRGIILQTSSKM